MKLLGSLLSLFGLISLAPVPRTSSDDMQALQQEILAGYAATAHAWYAECELHAQVLESAIAELVGAPSPATLAAAREAWLRGREDYGKTEALRFYNGPIDNPVDGVETFLNAWPLDEAYIDYVADAPGSGIINDPDRYPHLDSTLLTLLNERGGEANVSIGWHAIEFLLWGQDDDPQGPGDRPHTDYVPDGRNHAERRAEYLTQLASMLVAHHEQLRKAWEPDRQNYRAAFLSAPPQESLRKVFAGMVILSGFEMAGERLAVAYETQDQEEEHSCFSDNTHVDFRANQQGLLAVFRGSEGKQRKPGLRALAERVDARLAADLDAQLEATLEAIQAMPVPFDQAILGADESPHRMAVLKALEALERQSETMSLLASVLGYEIALQPGG